MANSREWQRLTEEHQNQIRSFQGGGNIPVGALAHSLGIQIKVANLGPGVSGQISKSGNSYVIKVNRFETKERQRYTVAHELAHFLLHRDLIDSLEDGLTDNILYRSGAPEYIEFEANRLAADILMPSESVRNRLVEYGGQVTEAVIADVANYFRVSKAAMEIRLSNLPI